MPFSSFVELAGLQAAVESVCYTPGLDAPADRPYPFSYSVTIRNDSRQTVTIRARKWVITDSSNCQEVTECDGVFGKFPRLAPGQTFSYSHYHVIGSDCRAEGAFFGLAEDGTAVFIRIQPFEMRVPL